MSENISPTPESPHGDEGYIDQQAYNGGRHTRTSPYELSAGDACTLRLRIFGSDQSRYAVDISLRFIDINTDTGEAMFIGALNENSLRQVVTLPFDTDGFAICEMDVIDTTEDGPGTSIEWGYVTNEHGGDGPNDDAPGANRPDNWDDALRELVASALTTTGA